jgi:uncharacterized membrane protein YfhO
LKNLHVLPRAFLVSRKHIEVIPDEKAQLARVRDSGFDPANVVILQSQVESNKVGISSDEPENGATSVTKYEEGQNWIRIQAKAAVPSILVLSQIYYPGWSVLVDGSESSIVRTNYAFTGVPLESGIHDIQFRFRPRSFVLGAAVSVFSLLSMGLAALLRRA